ncbi:MAG: hypothetical protein SV429_06170 [Pseudomonadota bacterium]|nr:hypothetical protein [Pseudomonadota bacterium]
MLFYSIDDGRMKNHGATVIHYLTKSVIENPHLSGNSSEVSCSSRDSMNKRGRCFFSKRLDDEVSVRTPEGWKSVFVIGIRYQAPDE